MELLLRCSVRPRYAQLELRDRMCRGYPEWETGDEPVVAIPGCVAVATIEDRTGSVVVEAWRGEGLPDGAAHARAVSTGRWVATGLGVLVGSTVGNEFHEVPLPAGVYTLRVLVAPGAGRPSAVWFVFGVP